MAVPFRAAMLSTSPACCLPLTETAGTVAADITGNGRNGEYSSDVSTWAARDTALGLSVPYFDGTRSVNLLPGGTDLATCCDWDEFSAAIFCKVSGVGDWSDAANRYVIHLQAANGGGGLNRHILWKSSDVNEFASRGYFDGIDSQFTHYTSTIYWMPVLWTISRSANQFKMYIGNIQIGATQTIGNDFSEATLTRALLGAYTIGPLTLPWKGWLAYFALWNRVLTAAEWKRLICGGASYLHPGYADFISRVDFSAFVCVEDVT